MIKAARGSFTGAGRYPPARQRIVQRLLLDRPGSKVKAVVRLRNEGGTASRFILSASSIDRLRGRWLLGHRDVTGRVTGNGLLTDLFAPGSRSAADAGREAGWPHEGGHPAAHRLTATTVAGAPSARDQVTSKVRVRR